MTDPKPVGLPGLESFGTRTVDDLQSAGIAPVKLALDLPEVNYVAFDKVPEKLQPVVRRDAKTLAMSPNLDQLTFINLVTDDQYSANLTEGINAVLANVKARDAGEAGKRVVMITNRCDRFAKQMPKFDPRLIAKLEQGKATASEILSALKWFGWQMKGYVKGYNSMLELCDEEESYHNEQGQKSITACATDLVISKQENDRQIKTNRLAALLECLQDELNTRLQKEQLTDEEQTRLLNVSTLITARLKNLYGSVQSANQSFKRFAYQSNSNALTALNQLDFARFGIADWKANIVSEMDAIQNVANNMAYLEAVNFTEEQAMRTADSFDKQMASMAQMLKTAMYSVKAIERMTESLVNAGKTMSTAFEEARKDQDTTAKMVEKGLKKVEASEKELRQQMVEVHNKYGFHPAS